MSELISKSGWGGPRPNSGGARPGAGRPPKIAFQRPAPDGPRWYVVRTFAGAEGDAAFEIGFVGGFDVYYPTVWVPSSAARRIGHANRPARLARVSPLFQRYLFVRFCRRSDRWQPIRSFPGVEGILGPAQDDPVAIPDTAIEAIRNLPGMRANGCRYPAGVALDDLSAVPVLELGALVHVVDGPLADLSGIIESCTARQARVLVTLLGAAVTLTVPRRSIEAA